MSIRRSMFIACVLAGLSRMNPAAAATCELEVLTLHVVPVSTSSTKAVIACSGGAPSRLELTLFASPGPTINEYTAGDKSPRISGKFSEAKSATDLLGTYVRDAAPSRDGNAVFRKGDATFTAANVPAYISKLYFKVGTN